MIRWKDGHEQKVCEQDPSLVTEKVDACLKFEEYATSYPHDAYVNMLRPNEVPIESPCSPLSATDLLVFMKHSDEKSTLRRKRSASIRLKSAGRRPSHRIDSSSRTILINCCIHK